MLIWILYNFTWFCTVDLYIVNWYVLKCDDCPYRHVINVCHLCACLCLQGLFPNLWYACTRYTEGNTLNWIELNWMDWTVIEAIDLLPESWHAPDWSQKLCHKTWYQHYYRRILFSTVCDAFSILVVHTSP